MNTNKFSLIVTKGELQDARFEIKSEGSILGRSSLSDISIKDPLLSRSHCRFEERNGELWVTDLASANDTLVNGEIVDEKQLQSGDLITVGNTNLQVQVAPDSAPVLFPEVVAEAPLSGDVVIDLGFGPQEGTGSSEHKKTFLRPILWALGAVLLLILAVTFIMQPPEQQNLANNVQQVTTATDRTMVIHYEKVEAAAANIFRFELNLSASGELAVKIDDLAGKNRHVRESKTIDKEQLDDLARKIENSGFFSLEPSYTGFASRPNELNEFTMTIAMGSKVHTSRVINRQEPEVFRAIREELETFSKNELGIWAIQFSSEKLIELAKGAMAVAQKKFNEKDVQFNNLYEAMRNFQEAIFYLDTVNPKPDFYGTIIDGFEEAEAELDKRYEEQRFLANRAINLQDWPAAARELKILREMLPEKTDPRHKEATQKLLDVENRLRRQR